MIRRYKPLSDGRGYVSPQGSSSTADPEYIKTGILRQLSAISTEVELEEYNKIPAEWFNLMHPDISCWGVHGELLETFFQTVNNLAETNPELLVSIFDNKIDEYIANEKSFLKSINNLYASVNEKFFPTRISNGKGLRFETTNLKIITETIDNRSYGKPLSKVLRPQDINILGFTMLALSCSDRVDKPGSPFVKKDYELLTNFWQEYIIPLEGN